MANFKTLENPFNFTDIEVRTAIDINNDAWFCAKDVCEVLEISWSGRGNTLRSIPEAWVMVSYHETIKGERETIFINEAALYKMIFRSSKPKAEEFANWVCGEVLPQIRKHGFYGILPPKDYLAVIKQIDLLTIRLINSKNAFTHALLVNPLKSLCNMAGHPMPEITLISQTLEQDDLFADDAQKKLAGAK